MPVINKKRVKTIKKKQELKTFSNEYSKYYSSQTWRNLREWYYKNHPVCECCEAHGRVNPTEHIHHIVNFMNGVTEADKWRLLGDPNNCIALCRTCHLAIHTKIDRSGIITGCSELSDEEYNKVHNLA